MRVVRGLAAALLVTGSAGGAQPSRADWEPAGKWEVNFADQQCLAFRVYKRGQDTVQIALEAIPASKDFQLHLIVPKGEVNRWTGATVEVGNRRIEASRLGEIVLGAGQLRAIGSEFSEEEVARLERGEALAIGAGGQMFRAPLASLPAVRKHLATCVSDLLRTWGYPLEQQSVIVAYPEAVGGNASGFFRVEDYPAGAIRAEGDGRVRALLRVGTNGRAKDCKVVLSSRSAELDATTCGVLRQRGRFVTAKDSAGRSVEAPIVITVAWILPD